jgi:hypothetical protein
MKMHKAPNEIDFLLGKKILSLHSESDNIRFFSLGRHAIKAAITSIGIKKGDAVLMPSFICKEVLASIYECEAQPMVYDLNKDLQPISLPINNKIKALIAVNYFGFPQNLTIFKQYCTENNVALIEDNAHSFLSVDSSGQILGTRGDFGITSYRKILPIREGASLLLNSKKYHIEGGQLPSNLTRSSKIQKIRSLIQWVERRAGIRLTPIGKALIRKIRKVSSGYEIKPSGDEFELATPQPENPPSYLRRCIKHTDAGLEIARRRLLYIKFHTQLSSTGIEPVFNVLNEGICPYGYPFYADDDVAAEIVKIARGEGYDCFKWPELPSTVPVPSQPHYHQLWVINFLC